MDSSPLESGFWLPRREEPQRVGICRLRRVFQRCGACLIVGPGSANSGHSTSPPESSTIRRELCDGCAAGARV